MAWLGVVASRDILWDSSNTSVNGSSTPAWMGYAGCGISVLFFGTNFAPIKKFETGDGMFFQWIVCTAIWLVGLCVHAVRDFPTFYPLAMLGGFVWATGNVMVVPIVKTVGLAQGLLVWASCNLLLGWASGRFGWFGLNPEVPSDTIMNYVGVSLCVLSCIIYVFIKSDTGTASQQDDYSSILNHTDYDGPDNSISDSSILSDQVSILTQEDDIYSRMSSRTKKIVGIGMSMVAGCLFGCAFNPVIYVQDNYLPRPPHPDAPSQNGLDYVFAVFSGIYATSTTLFIAYCIYMKNKPRLYPRVILPGFVSGVMWGIADSSWFVANSALSAAISFPIITTGPGVISALLGVFVFKEIRGVRNYVILLCACSCAIAGTVLVGISK